MTSQVTEVDQLDINQFTEKQLDKIASAASRRGGNHRIVAQTIEEQRRGRVRFFTVAGFLRLRNNLHGDSSPAPLNGWLDRFLIDWLDSNSKWRSPESLDDVVFKQTPRFRFMTCLPEGCENMSAWERLKSAWLDTDENGMNFNRSYVGISTGCFSIAGGLLFGSQHAFRHLQEYTKHAQARKFLSKGDLLRSQSNVFARSLFTYGVRWGWRISFICASFIAVSQSLQIYRLKDSWTHYSLGIAIPYTLYNWPRGPLGMLAMGASAAILVGLPVGLMLGTLEQNARPILYSAFAFPITENVARLSRWSEEEVRTNTTHYDDIIKYINNKEDVL